MYVHENGLSADIELYECPNCGYSKNVLLGISGLPAGGIFAIPPEWMETTCPKCGDTMKESEL